MTASSPDPGRSGGPAVGAGANVGRGIAVIVGAVLLGLFLMAQGIADGDLRSDDSADGGIELDENADDAGDDTTDGGETDAGDDGTTTSTGEDTDTTDPADATATTDPTATEGSEATTDDTLGAQRDPATVRTLAVNGTDPPESGLAGRVSSRLESEGYGAAPPANAQRPGASRIIYVDGYESDARAIAQALGVDPDALLEPFDPAASPVDDTREAHVIVVAGTDGVIRP